MCRTERAVQLEQRGQCRVTAGRGCEVVVDYVSAQNKQLSVYGLRGYLHHSACFGARADAVAHLAQLRFRGRLWAPINSAQTMRSVYTLRNVTPLHTSTQQLHQYNCGNTGGLHACVPGASQQRQPRQRVRESIGARGGSICFGRHADATVLYDFNILCMNLCYEPCAGGRVFHQSKHALIMKSGNHACFGVMGRFASSQAEFRWLADAPCATPPARRPGRVAPGWQQLARRTLRLHATSALYAIAVELQSHIACGPRGLVFAGHLYRRLAAPHAQTHPRNQAPRCTAPLHGFTCSNATQRLASL